VIEAEFAPILQRFDVFGFLRNFQTIVLPDSYLRYLTNSLRDCFDMGGIPIRITCAKPAILTWSGVNCLSIL
jgi:hypothetical protein